MRLNLKSAFYITGFLCLWAFLCSWKAVPTYILPHPYDVFISLKTHAGLLLWHSSISLLEIILGITIGILLAAFMTLFFETMPKIRHSLLSSLVSLQTIPIFAIIPLFLLWFGHGLFTKILIVGLSSFFPITVNVIQGLERCPSVYEDMGRLMQMKKINFFLHIKFPYSLPYFMAGLKIAAVHAPVTVIAADWIGATHGLGYLIMLASGRLQLDMMFACIFILVAYSLSFHKLICTLQKGILFWRSDS